MSERQGAAPDRSLQGHLRILRRRKWVIVQVLLAVTLGAAVLSFREHARYRATASVLLSRDATAAGASTDTSSDRDERTAVEIASMPLVAHATLRSVPGEQGRSVSDFLRSAQVDARAGSDVLDFSVEDSVPRRAVVLATAYARRFIDVRRSLATDAVDAVQQRLRQARADTASARVAAAGGTSSSEAVLVQPALSAHRVAPRPVRTIAIGIVLGLIAGISLAYLWDALNPRVHDVSEVEETLRRKLLGTAREPAARRSGLVLQTDPFGGAAEAFRILRANIEFANLDRQAQVILVTGSVDGEGRSTTLANLGVACALGGREVVLVDLHLRHPALDQLFGFPGRCGLTDVALGHVSLDEALAAVPMRPAVAAEEVGETGSLRVLTSGPPPPDSGEFVGTRAVAETIDDLRARADLVFLDAPPLLPVGDARTLSRLADALLPVVNLGSATRPMLRELRRVLDACPTPTLGFVATGVSPERHDPYGGYYSPRGRRHASAERVL
jgi:non-specific protein-tyrosine kinase